MWPDSLPTMPFPLIDETGPFLHKRINQQKSDISSGLFQKLMWGNGYLWGYFDTDGQVTVCQVTILQQNFFNGESCFKTLNSNVFTNFIFMNCQLKLWPFFIQWKIMFLLQVLKYHAKEDAWSPVAALFILQTFCSAPKYDTLFPPLACRGL